MKKCGSLEYEYFQFGWKNRNRLGGSHSAQVTVRDKPGSGSAVTHTYAKPGPVDPHFELLFSSLGSFVRRHCIYTRLKDNGN
jgi:hypothetical protein